MTKGRIYKTVGRCTACNNKGDLDLHHLISRGAGGPDSEENLMPLCRLCHTRLHVKGLLHMTEQFPQLVKWLKGSGWELTDWPKKRWLPPFKY